MTSSNLGLEESPLTARSPEYYEVLDFHRQTDLSAANFHLFAQRAGLYAATARGKQEMAANRKNYWVGKTVRLPPVPDSAEAFLQTVRRRRSVRVFAGEPVTLAEVSALLGCARPTGVVALDEAGSTLHLRGYPAGGGLYCSELYIIGLVNGATGGDGLPAGIFHYAPELDVLEIVSGPLGDGILCTAIVGAEDYLEGASAVAVFTTVLARATTKYGFRGYRFALLESGMCSYLLSLIATAIDIGTLHYGGFLEDRLGSLLGLDAEVETAVNVVFIGRQR